MHKSWIAVLVIFFILLGFTSCSYKEEEAILNKIETNYNVNVRPEVATREPVKIRFDVRMKSINALSVKQQVLNMDVFVVIKWFDPRLTWNRTLYNGTDRVNLMSSLLWTPDVMLFNKADPAPMLYTNLYTSKILIFSNGECTWRNLVTLLVSCELDITWFPIDKQKCELSFGSWSYSSSQLHLIFLSKPKDKESLKSDNFQVDSGEWVISEFAASQENIKFNCCPEAFSSIKYTISMSRVSTYYFMYILLPLISLAFLFLLVFHIPSDSGERMGFGVTILLSITVYLLVISEKLPEKSDDTPMLGICFITIFYILVIALSMAAGTTIFSRRTSKPPDWLINLTAKGRSKLNKEDVPNQKKVRPVNSNGMDGVIHISKSTSTIDRNDNEQQMEQQQRIKSLTELEADYNADWIRICRWFDKKMFVIYCAILILVPVIVTLSLPTDHLA